MVAYFSRWNTVAVCVTAAALSGCATHIPVNREVGNLDFSYQASAKTKATGKSVAIVSPQFVAAEAAAQVSTQPDSRNALALLMAAQTGLRQTYTPQAVYQATYQQRLGDAMMGAIQEIISKKGFNTKGPYASFDDIPFGDKKTIYLAAVPSLKVYFDAKSQQFSCSGMVCTDQGVFTVTGELIYKMVEPMTGQAVVTKRINLSDFAISKSYLREFQGRTASDGLVGMAIDRAMKPEQLRDNTDRVMTEALNEFFKKAMTKVDSFVSTEELMSFEGDIAQLKGMKRF